MLSSKKNHQPLEEIVMNSPSPGLETENQSRYQVDSRREIMSILRGLRDANQLVSMIIDNGSEVIITAILEVDDDNNCFVLDLPSTEEATQRLLKTNRIYFETMLHKISIRFSCSGVTLGDFTGGPALICAIPPNLNRLQRRECYRVNAPLSHPIMCVIPIPQEKEVGTVELPLIDISCSGIAIWDEKQVLDVEFGTLYGNCEIDLPGIGVVNVTLQIRNSHDLVLMNHKTNRRVGCEFIDLSKKTLSQIQKLITKIEREQNARQTGLG